MAKATQDNVFDVIIIGAGISGINSAYRVQTKIPGASYAILESRTAMGGTWDLFRYPGIRSDSDLHTFGFAWRPWMDVRPIADGPAIVEYVEQSAAEYGIDKHILYRHRVLDADFSSERQNWALTVEVSTDDGAEPQTKVFYGSHLVLGTGYYNYKTPLETVIPGIDSFKGTVVHPQFWPEDLDYSGKKIVIIGSGATAITLVPTLAKTAEHVTMLQRSPTFLISQPNFAKGSWISKFLPSYFLAKLSRWKFLGLRQIFYLFCQVWPQTARNLLIKATKRQLPKHISVEPHFQPKYNPWEQRLCLCPDGDFFKALRGGKANVATGEIDTVTEHGVTLKSGEKLEADMIVTATGLKLQIAGGIHITVDKELVEPGKKFLWRSMMLQDVPNLCFIIGYTNTSWTLGADASVLLFCRIINEIRRQKATSAVPFLEHPELMKPMSAFNLSSTYIEKAKHLIPRCGDSGPWMPRDNYYRDTWTAWFGSIHKGLLYKKVST